MKEIGCILLLALGLTALWVQAGSGMPLVFRILLFSVCFLFTASLFSQNMSINATGAKPDTSAMLDVSSTSKGFLMPRMTMAQRDAIFEPAHGLMVFQLDGNSGLYIFDTISTSWTQVLDSADAVRTLSDVLGHSSDAQADSIVNIGAVGIGTASPAHPLDVAGTASIDQLNINSAFTFPATDGTNGQFLQTNGAGTVSWATDTDDGNGIYSASGTLTGNRVVTQGANTLSLTSTATNGFSVDGTTFSVDAANNRIGIGTAAPTNPLHIKADGSDQVLIEPSATTGQNAVLTIRGARNNSTTQNHALLHLQNYDNDLTASNYLGSIGGRVSNGTTNVGDMLFFNYADGATATETMRLTSTGLIGLGAAAPGYKLDVNGAIRSGIAGTDGQYRLYSEQGTTDYEVVFNPHATMTQSTTYTLPADDGTASQVLTTDGAGALSWAAPTGDNLGNHTATQNLLLGNNYLSNDGGSEGISIATNGTVVITGASAGLQALTVNGNIRTFNQGNGLELTNDQISITGNNSNTGDMIFETGGVSRMRLLSGGFLGIGNTNPSHMLDVNGVIRSGSNGTDGQYRLFSEQGATDYEVAFNPHAAMTQNVTYTLPADDGTANQVLNTDGAGALSWATPATDGNGIYGGSGSLSANTIVTQATNTLSFTSTATNGFSVDGTTFSVDALNNRVGIGTSAPGVPLHITGGSDAALASGGYLMTGNSTAGNILMDNNEIMARNNGLESSLFLQSDGGDLTVHSAQGGGTQFVVKDDGKVGLRTSTPQVPLHIGGSTADVTLTTGGMLLIGDTNSLNMVLDDNEIMVRNNGVANAMQLQREGGDLFVHNGMNDSTKFVIKNNGYVGIGTVNPTSELSVDGDIEVRSGHEYTYSSQRGRNFTISPAAYTETSANNDLLASGQGRYFNGSGGGDVFADVQLPDGAIVNVIRFFLLDNITGTIQLQFYELDNSTGVATALLSSPITNSSNTASLQMVEATGLNIEIDTQNNSYYILYDFSVSSSSLALYATRVFYYVTKAN